MNPTTVAPAGVLTVAGEVLPRPLADLLRSDRWIAGVRPVVDVTGQPRAVVEVLPGESAPQRWRELLTGPVRDMRRRERVRPESCLDALKDAVAGDGVRVLRRLDGFAEARDRRVDGTATIDIHRDALRVELALAHTPEGLAVDLEEVLAEVLLARTSPARWVYPVVDPGKRTLLLRAALPTALVPADRVVAALELILSSVLRCAARHQATIAALASTPRALELLARGFRPDRQ